MTKGGGDEVMCLCSMSPNPLKFRNFLRKQLNLPNTPHPDHEFRADEETPLGRIRCVLCGPNAPAVASLNVASNQHNDTCNHGLVLHPRQALKIGAQFEAAVRELQECRGNIPLVSLGSQPTAEPLPTLPYFFSVNLASEHAIVYNLIRSRQAQPFSPETLREILYEWQLSFPTMFLQPREMETAIAAHVLRHGPHGPQGPHQHHGPQALRRLLVHVNLASRQPHEASCYHERPLDDCTFCQFAVNATKRLKQFFFVKSIYWNDLLALNISSTHVLDMRTQVDRLARVHFYRLFHGGGTAPSCHCRALRPAYTVQSPTSFRPWRIGNWLKTTLQGMLLEGECQSHSCANCQTLIANQPKCCRLCSEQGLMVTAYYCTPVCQKADWPRHRYLHSLLIPESLPRIFFRIPITFFDDV